VLALPALATAGRLRRTPAEKGACPEASPRQPQTAVSRTNGDPMASAFAPTQGDPSVTKTSAPRTALATASNSRQASVATARAAPMTAAATASAMSTAVAHDACGSRRKSPLGQMPKICNGRKGRTRFPSSAPLPGTTAVPGTMAEVVSAARLRALAAAAGRSIYWAGARPGTRLEYTQKTDGTTYVR
jgi:hypothetical protein